MWKVNNLLWCACYKQPVSISGGNVQCLKCHDYDHITFSESSKLRLEMKFLLLSIHVHISCCICSTSKVTLFLHWRSKSSGMWCCVVEQVDPEVLKEHGVFRTTGITSPTIQDHIPEDLQLQQHHYKISYLEPFLCYLNNKQNINFTHTYIFFRK